VEFKKCIAVFDEKKPLQSQIRREQYENRKANNVLISSSRLPGLPDRGQQDRAQSNRTIKADPVTYQTGEPDVLAGGDALSGPKFAIDAIARARKADLIIVMFTPVRA
jgi:NADPH-dependent glutamate synthase beta subunit-like oxidoreductase